MKKILTVSLFAVMAVSAAHADIASTNYVGMQIQNFNTNTVVPLGNKVGSATFTNGVAAGKTDVTAAIDAVAGAVAGLSGEGGEVAGALADAKAYADSLASNYDAAGSADQALADAKEYANGLASNYDAAGSADQALADAKEYANGLASNYDATGSAATAESNAKKYTDDQVKTLNSVQGDAVADGNYVVQTTEANGIVTVSRQAFDTSISNDDNAVHSTVTAPTTKAVATYVADQIGTVTTQANSVQNAVDAIYKKVGQEETGILPTIQNDLQGQIDEINDAENGVLAQAKSDTDVKIDALDATVAVEANSNKFVTGVVEENGVLTSVQSSTINAAVVALANVPEACAAGGQKKCALSVQDGDFSWEVIEP